MENKKPIVKSVTDILGDGRVHWHEELEQVSVKNLLEQEYIIREIKIVEGWQSQFGENDFALLLLECPDTGKQFTTLAGASALKAFAYSVRETRSPGQRNDNSGGLSLYRQYLL